MAAEAQTMALAELLREHPWPSGGSEDRRLDYLWSFDLKSTPEALWDALTDTSRLNRALGLGELSFEERDGQLHGHSVSAGIEHRWVERPWSWVHGRYMEAERIYSHGLCHRVRVIYRFESLSEGVRFHAYFGFEPRSWWSGLLVRLGMLPLKGRLGRVLDEIARATADALPDALVEDGGELTPAAERRLAASRRQLLERGMSADAVDRIITLVRDGDAMDLHRLQPRGLAHRWGLPEREVLRAFLHATRVGLLDLSWDVICPHCRGVRKALLTLGEVPEGDRCDACEIEFGTDGANAVEISFHVHPSIREVPQQMFCSAQTSAKRHIEVQQLVGPGESLRVPTALGPGRHRLRLQGRLEVAFLDLKDGGDGELSWRVSDEADRLGGAPEPALELVNDSDAPQIFIVEDVNWADDALRPGHLFAFQDFRDLFTEEFIHADVHLSVGEQTILFSDIVGSTALYLDRGDPEAFVAVRKHFSEIYEVVSAHEGALVKTIGDATMATFGDPLQALRAAREVQGRFTADRAGAAPIRVRCSLHTGVCIAVNLNRNIDYFGNTVNLAAKLQLCSGAGDIAFSEAVLAAPGVEPYLQEQGAVIEDVSFDFKPLGRTITVHRWATDEDEESLQTRRF